MTEAREGWQPIPITEVTPENMPTVIGAMLAGMNYIGAALDQNLADHQDIKARLDTHDNYLVIFRVSRCTLNWLKDSSNLKWAVIMGIFFTVDWVSRWLYWNIFTRP